MFKSEMQERGRVQFPLFAGERHYMIPFFQSEGLPAHLSHWQPTVDAMLEGVETYAPIYFMADQAVVQAGQPHRRPGVHVDGYWHPDLSAHGGGHRGSGHGGFPPSHRGSGGHGGRHMAGGWDVVDFSEPEALILASNVSAARAYIGEYAGPIGEGGDASRVDTTNMRILPMQRNITYFGTVETLHESTHVYADSHRTLVRLNCPGVTLQ
jgi:hypothetical protein